MAGMDETFSDINYMANEDLRLLIAMEDLVGLDQYINNGGSVNGQYRHGKTPLFLAISKSHLQTLSSSEKSSVGEAKISHTDKIILCLICAGADVHATTEYGYTPLMEALKWQLNKKIILELLNAGSDINAESNDKKSPLMLAVTVGYDKELICYLIERGADVNHVSTDGSTPLFSAFSCADRYEIAEILLDAGADPNERSCWRMVNNPLDFLCSCIEGNCKNKKLINLLVNKGLDLNICSAFFHSGDDRTLIHEVKCNYLISLCIKSGVSVESKDKNGYTPLICAVKCRSKFNKAKSLLIKFNADPNYGDKELKTPLHHAVQYGSPKICELLLYHRSNIFAEDINNETPLDLVFYNIEMLHTLHILMFSGGISLVNYYLLYVDENISYDYYRKRNRNVSRENFKSFLVNCENLKVELGKMKNTFLKDGLTFYEFCRLKRFYQSTPIDMSLDELNYNCDQIEEMFPHYHRFIITRIKDNLIKNNKKHLMNSLEGIIIRPLPIDENDPFLNYDCKRLIARYFNREELVTLFQVSTED